RDHPVSSSSYAYRQHPELHSFPTRRSSDLKTRSARKEPAIAQIQRLRLGRSLSPTLETTGVTSGCSPWLLSCLSSSISANLIIEDRKSTRLNSSHVKISYAVFCLKKKTNNV